MAKSTLSFSSILAWLLAAFFLFGFYGNAFITVDYAAAYARWGYPNWFHYLTAALELAAALLLIGSGTRIYGAGLGAVVMAAATLTTLAHGDYSHTTAPAIVLLVSLTVLALSLAARRRTT